MHFLEGNANQYTFFAPVSSSFSMAVPADAVDPFSYDKQLRHNVLLRHFVHLNLTREHLQSDNLTELTMIDNTTFTLTHSDGKWHIDTIVRDQKFINSFIWY